MLEFFRCFNPESDGFIHIPQCDFVVFSMGHATRQFGNFRDISLILIAPVDDDLIFMHDGYREFVPQSHNASTKTSNRKTKYWRLIVPQ